MVWWKRRRAWIAVIVGQESGHVSALPFVRFRRERDAVEWVLAMNAKHDHDGLTRYSYRPVPAWCYFCAQRITWRPELRAWATAATVDSQACPRSPLCHHLPVFDKSDVRFLDPVDRPESHQEPR